MKAWIRTLSIVTATAALAVATVAPSLAHHAVNVGPWGNDNCAPFTAHLVGNQGLQGRVCYELRGSEGQLRIVADWVGDAGWLLATARVRQVGRGCDNAAPNAASRCMWQADQMSLTVNTGAGNDTIHVQRSLLLPAIQKLAEQFVEAIVAILIGLLVP